MNIRFMGATDQIERLQKIFIEFELETSLYANRGTNKIKRLYSSLDDRETDRVLDKIEDLIFSQKRIKNVK